MRWPAALVFAAVLLTCPGCSREEKAQDAAENAIPVKIGEVRHVRDREVVPVSGTVASPDAPTEVTFLVSGKVLQVGPREGDYVREGQLIAAIDPTDYSLALQAASAQVKQAKIAFERARDEYGRMKFLFDNKSLAANDFEKFKAAQAIAKEQLDQAAANEKLCRKRLDDASLHAPIGGFVSKRSIEPGETASPGRPVFEIVRLDPVEISVGVPETDIHCVRIGQEAEIRIPALSGQRFQGTVRVVNVSADPGTRTYLTRISAPNPGHVLRIGMIAEARILGDRLVDLMTLPAEAIVRDPQGATMVFVYYPDRGGVYARRVGTGTVYGREIAVTSGLAGDEAIVVAGQEKLRDGVRVTVITGDTPLENVMPLRGKENRQ